MNIIKIGVTTVASAIVLACHASGFVPPTTTSADVGTEPNERALKDLIRERCAHEVNCGDVGKGHVDASYDACISRTRPPTRDALLSHGCNHAIDDARLSRCVDSIRKESCGKPTEAIDDVASCGTVDLCP